MTFCEQNTADGVAFASAEVPDQEPSGAQSEGEDKERQRPLMTGDTAAAAIAHEVRQPLAAMITHAAVGLRWLDRPTPDLEKAKAALMKIVADGHRAAAVIEGIGANFKKNSRNIGSLDINQLIRETLGTMQGDLRRRRIRVETELDARRPRVKGDRIQLQQVLVNLITNAIELMAAKPGPRVLGVRSEVDGADVVVSVTDTGTGIRSQELERIFNPFFTTKTGGMGMGLSICRSIIEAHDGRLWAVPNKPEGAVFRLMLAADGICADRRPEARRRQKQAQRWREFHNAGDPGRSVASLSQDEGVAFWKTNAFWRSMGQERAVGCDKALYQSS